MSRRKDHINSKLKQDERRKFIKKTSLITTSAFLLPNFGFGKSTSALCYVNNFVEAKTSYGKVRGITEEGVNLFKGIPYAGSVSGEQRFRRPAPLKAWKGVRDALQFGAPAIQSPRRNEPDPAEDCLFLNVWTPANDNKKRPVMFYSHGGGFVIGSGASPGQDGSNLARNFDVVVVETNHRLGLLGFLYLDEIAGEEYAGSGNMGVLDITAGLKWVHENIAEFGGDPDNVMIFGESGGGAKTSCLYAMPEAAPYFNKASIESGPGVRMLSKEMANQTTLLVLKELGISPNNWKKLLEVPAADLLKVQSQIPFTPPYQEKTKTGGITEPKAGGFGPVVDSVALLNHPFDPTAPKISKEKPLMVGWNEDEYTFFAWERKDTSSFNLDFEGLATKLEPQFGENTSEVIAAYKKARPEASATDIFVAVQSIVMMGLGSIEIAEKKAMQNGAPVYLYNFGYKSEMKIPGTDYPMGTPHAMDISFKFNNEVPPKDGEPPRMSFGGKRPEKYEASRKMAELWATFAKTGKPAAKDVPEWPAFNLEDRATMRIDENCEVIYDRFHTELEMWRSIGRLQ
ncbi:carboxylesterase/lipase family protein [Chondrinema litorale]|uniref:carboxylesterase/lipase family protein n=1 Tax=Chondrinema litorale TaxID=2994555 RepID=UPI0025433E87|nr:carboxylesterase/lipase family protein [Chondrinema litorale]UZR96841.1 carboxylesterase/lipase family protein [Chondrinema litorale]